MIDGAARGLPTLPALARFVVAWLRKVLQSAIPAERRGWRRNQARQAILRLRPSLWFLEPFLSGPLGEVYLP